MHDDNDNTLMELTQSGDKKAYEELVLKHRVKAIEFANSFVFNYYTAEDIVQECFAKIYISRQRYKPSFTFKTYLFTVIRNRCIDELRRAKPLSPINFDEEFEISDLNTPEKMMVERERYQTIFANLNGLQDAYKTALYLYAVEEMSYKQIAEIMQKSMLQTKILIYRARKKLKTLCKGAGIREN